VTLSHLEYAPRIVPIGADGDTTIGTVQLSRGGSIACTIDRQKIGEDANLSAELYQFVTGDTFRRRSTSSLGSGETLLNFANLEPGDYGILLKGTARMEQLIVLVTVSAGAVSDARRDCSVRSHLRALGQESLWRRNIRLHNSGVLERRI
jgi:hypothetical protein